MGTFHIKRLTEWDDTLTKTDPMHSTHPYILERALEHDSVGSGHDLDNEFAGFAVREPAGSAAPWRLFASDLGVGDEDDEICDVVRHFGED